MSAPVNPWTDERVELLKLLWGNGKSASEIAVKLGPGFTRNSVIGKAHRLKLTMRVNPSTPKRIYKPRLTSPDAPPLVKAVKPTFTTPKPPTRLPGAVTHSLCQWPMNEWPPGMGFTALFCHEPTTNGAYCCTHHKRSRSEFQPSRPPAPLSSNSRRAA